MVENVVDDVAMQDDVYYYGDDTYYVAEMDDTNDTDDEYAFYANKIEDEDNYNAITYEGQLLKTNVLSIINIVLFVLLVFFWVLWLVGTIFPNWIQDLYRNEGVVVKADVIEICAMNNEGASPVGGIVDVEANIISEGMSLPNYTTIISYTAPSRITRHGKGIGPSSIDNTHAVGDVQSKDQMSNNMMQTFSNKVSTQHLAADIQPTPTSKAIPSANTTLNVTSNYTRSKIPPHPPRSKLNAIKPLNLPL